MHQCFNPAVNLENSFIWPMLMGGQKFHNKNNFVPVSVELAFHGLMQKCYKKLVGRIKNRIIQPAPGYLLVILPC